MRVSGQKRSSAAVSCDARYFEKCAEIKQYYRLIVRAMSRREINGAFVAAFRLSTLKLLQYLKLLAEQYWHHRRLLAEHAVLFCLIVDGSWLSASL